MIDTILMLDLNFRAIRVLDEIAQEYQDPQVAIHWSNISSALECMIKVSITSTGYENVK